MMIEFVSVSPCSCQSFRDEMLFSGFFVSYYWAYVAGIYEFRDLILFLLLL